MWWKGKLERGGTRARKGKETRGGLLLWTGPLHGDDGMRRKSPIGIVAGS